jgi:adenosylhomocysteine nucleosidase
MRVLLVVAVEQEAVHLPPSLPLLVTGVAKVNAAVRVAAALADPATRPDVVVNVGTAGALHAGMAGTHEIGSVRQHDLDSMLVEQLTGRRDGEQIVLGAGPALVTGDVFVSDPVLRDALAREADLVDMEGYAVAAACRAFEVPVRLVKHVSDSADEGARLSWVESVEQASRALRGWLEQNL